MIAHHYLSALELARSAGQETAELSERARRALAEAGERALTLNAFAPGHPVLHRRARAHADGRPQRAHMLYRLMTAKITAAGPRSSEFEEAREALLACRRA